MNKYLRQFTFSLWPVLILIGGLLAVTSYDVAPWYIWGGLIAAGVIDGAIWLWLESRVRKASSVASQPTDLPIIRMCFNGQEFVLEGSRDKGDHWLLYGLITDYGSYTGLPTVSFRVPKSAVDLRLGYYMNLGHVLVDVSKPNEKLPRCYCANTDRVMSDFVPQPKPSL